VEFTSEASQFRHRWRENRYINTVRPVITYIYSCGNVSQPLRGIFSNFPSVTFYDLNWNVRQAWKNLRTIGIYSNADGCYVLPFSSKMSCDCPQRVSVLASDNQSDIRESATLHRYIIRVPSKKPPIPVAAPSKAWVCGRSPAEIACSNPTGGMDVCCECCMLLDRGLCDELITHAKESYRLWCVVVCDLETSWMRRT
jgi:hypothetical protein